MAMQFCTCIAREGSVDFPEFSTPLGFREIRSRKIIPICLDGLVVVGEEVAEVKGVNLEGIIS